MGRRRHAWREDRFHVLRRVRVPGTKGDRSDYRNAFCTGRPPPCRFNRQQPHLSECFDNRSAYAFDGKRRGACLVHVEVPKGLWLAQDADWIVGQNPAADLGLPFADGSTYTTGDRLRKQWAWKHRQKH